MAASSLRCVAIAYRIYDVDKVPADEQQKTQWALPQDDLVLLAIVGIKVCAAINSMFMITSSFYLTDNAIKVVAL